jgi:hypothetical protein
MAILSGPKWCIFTGFFWLKIETQLSEHLSWNFFHQALKLFFQDHTQNVNPNAQVVF